MIPPALVSLVLLMAGQEPQTLLGVARREIRLDGIVRSVNVGGDSLVLEVVSVTQPDGRTVRLPAPRAKRVLLDERTILRYQWRRANQGNARMLPARLSDVRVGDRAAVVGPNTGAGTDLLALRVVVGELPPPPTEPNVPAEGFPVPAPPRTNAGLDPDGVSHTRVVVPLVFPVAGGKVRWSDTFLTPRGGGSRRHHGQDLVAPKMTPLVACFDGTVVSVVREAVIGQGNSLTLRGDNGWSAAYLHVNNDTPGTDDGLGTTDYAFPPNIAPGVRVVAGQLLGWVGDSGNAEETGAHCHFELWRTKPGSGGGVYNAAPSLRAATHRKAPLP